MKNILVLKTITLVMLFTLLMHADVYCQEISLSELKHHLRFPFVYSATDSTVALDSSALTKGDWVKYKVSDSNNTTTYIFEGIVQEEGIKKNLWKIERELVDNESTPGPKFKTEPLIDEIMRTTDKKYKYYIDEEIIQDKKIEVLTQEWDNAAGNFKFSFSPDIPAFNGLVRYTFKSSAAEGKNIEVLYYLIDFGYANEKR